MTDYMFTTEDRATLQYRVTSRLREAIIKGEFEYEEKLVQEEWAKRLGVSRMPIREALKQLELEGLVRLEPRKVAVVLPISPDDVAEIYEIRALLEGKAVSISLEKLTTEDLHQLKSLVEQMEATSTTEKGVERYTCLNSNFHELLRKGCHWRRMHSMIDTLWKGVAIYTPTFLSDSLSHSQIEHRKILDCALNRDNKGIRHAVEQHILSTRDRLLTFMS